MHMVVIWLQVQHFLGDHEFVLSNPKSVPVFGKFKLSISLPHPAPVPLCLDVIPLSASIVYKARFCTRTMAGH